MLGLSSLSAFLVNAEVDSMEGVIDIGAGSESSLRRAAIGKAQAELRQEFDVREERRRELEFLEKGGNPLDFKLGPTVPVSVQSTSVTDQHTDHEAKGSFALIASPHGDSVDSCARPSGREPTTADNILLLNGEKDTLHGDKNSMHPIRRGHITSSEKFSWPDRCHNVKESEDLAMFCLGVRNQPCNRRNRSRSSRDSSHACSNELVSSGHNNRSSNLSSSRHNSRNVKGSLSEMNVHKSHTLSSTCNSKASSPNADMISKNMMSNKMDIKLGAEATTVPKKVGLADVAEIKESESNQPSQISVEKDSNALSFIPCCSMGEGEDGTSGGLHCTPCVAPETDNNGNFVTVSHLNESSSNVGENVLKNKGQIIRNCFSGSVAAKGLDSEFSYDKINCSLDENIAKNNCLISRKVESNSNGNGRNQTLVFEANLLMPDAEVNESRSIGVQATANSLMSVPKNFSVSNSQVKIGDEVCNGRSDLQNEAENFTNVEGMQLIQLGDGPNSKRTIICPEAGFPCTSVSLNCDPMEVTSSVKGSASTAATELPSSMESHLELEKEYEDTILEKARTIEASYKRTYELSLSTYHSVKRRKSHWDFVLEEMAWLSNDFMQERIWKTTAAAHLSQFVACSGRSQFGVQNLLNKQRKVAHTLAKSILQFWHLFEHQDGENPSMESSSDAEEPIGAQKTGKDIEGNKFKNSLRLPVHNYALRFMRYSKSADCSVQVEAPRTPDRISDARIFQFSQEDQYSEESFFHRVPFGAMKEYRNSVESHWARYERTGVTMFKEEFETSVFDSAAELGAQENEDEEDEGENGIYYLAGAYEGNKSSKKYVQRTKKSMQKSYAARSYKLGSDLPYMHCVESKLGSHSTLLTGKRPSNGLNVSSIPTKRVRTASRQRTATPIGAGVSTGGQLASKTDASSGETSSFQEDQNSVHGESQARKILELESTGDFVNQLPFDNTDISRKPKKKAKNLGYRNTLRSTDSVGLMSSPNGSSCTFEQQWQLDNISQHEQTDNLRKRLEGHQFGSNGNTGIYGQNAAKKLNVLKQLPEASMETLSPKSGMIPSPIASQMSNLSNSNKIIKMISSRDRSWKAKALKMPSVKPGFGIPWSVYEDQALVVLVHDLGPNWELVSDAINSTLQFKCIFRKPKECKERCKELMDRNACDGANSAEDSQPYHSTLPGIPKGSARQLLQHLQGPMEEDSLKAHFEKIILIMQHLPSHRDQNDNQEAKHFTTVHSSHILALSCPNNTNGGFLTPLDLCEVSMSSPDVLSPGYQGSHISGLADTNHPGSLVPVLPSSATNPLLQVSSGMVLGNGLSSPCATMNGPARDMQKYSISVPSPLPVDEQQRMQQYSQMLSSRNLPHLSAAVSGALSSGNDHDVRMPSGANELGTMCVKNRGMEIPWPALQGIGSQSVNNTVSPGIVHSSKVIGIASPINICNVAVSGQGFPMMRPHEALQMPQLGQNPEDQRQKIMQNIQMQVTHGSGPGVVSYNVLSSSFPNQTGPVQTFSVQHQQQQQIPQQMHVVSSNTHQPRLQGTNHSPHQQAYAFHIAKQQHQLQRRLLHQQFTAPNTSMPHSQPQLQHPMPYVASDNLQIQQQSSPQSVQLLSLNSQHPSTTRLMNPATVQAKQKQHHGPQGLCHGPQIGGSMPHQMLKQRQHQQLQQQPRHHPQQQQQSQQQAKVMKGIGKDSMMMHQNFPVDTAHVNGPSPASEIPRPEVEQPVMHLMQSQGLLPGSSGNPAPLTKQLGPQPSNLFQQQKMFSCPVQPSPKQQSQTLPRLNNNNEDQVQICPSKVLSASQQPVLSSSLARASHQQQQLHRQTSQQQKAVQMDHGTSSDTAMQSRNDRVEAKSQSMNMFQMGASTIPQWTTPNNVPSVSSVASSSH